MPAAPTRLPCHSLNVGGSRRNPPAAGEEESFLTRTPEWLPAQFPIRRSTFRISRLLSSPCPTRTLCSVFHLPLPSLMIAKDLRVFAYPMPSEVKKEIALEIAHVL